MKLHPVWKATLMACGAFYSFEAIAAAVKSYDVDIQAQLLRTALPLIKEQTGLTFWFAAGTEPQERRVPALSGAYTAEALLSRLLSGPISLFSPCRARDTRSASRRARLRQALRSFRRF